LFLDVNWHLTDFSEILSVDDAGDVDDDDHVRARFHGQER
jgi:hypothetical protein